mmetsp:Transcript_102211/g.284705  ORF Transcript_102211/g.284705 Transcript_102211/m.284705 type:complete len:233 (+) Transcript_102211:104-802(+)
MAQLASEQPWRALGTHIKFARDPDVTFRPLADELVRVHNHLIPWNWPVASQCRVLIQQRLHRGQIHHRRPHIATGTSPLTGTGGQRPRWRLWKEANNIKRRVLVVLHHRHLLLAIHQPTQALLHRHEVAMLLQTLQDRRLRQQQVHAPLSQGRLQTTTIIGFAAHKHCQSFVHHLRHDGIDLFDNCNRLQALGSSQQLDGWGIKLRRLGQSCCHGTCCQWRRRHGHPTDFGT